MPNLLNLLQADTSDFQFCVDEKIGDDCAPVPSSQNRESHQEREILLVLEGNTSFLLNDRLYTTQPGSAFFINHWVPHQAEYGDLSNSPSFVHLWVHLHPGRMFVQIFCHPRQLLYLQDFSPALPAVLENRWDKAEKETTTRQRRLEILQSISRLAKEEIILFLEHSQSSHGKSTISLAAWLHNHIAANFGRGCSLTTLEKLTGFSRFYLMRCFKQEYGQTMGDYINDLRRQFLKSASSQMTQKEMAAQLGFQSASAFWLWKHRDQQRQKK
ncbi:MAG: AraC family transcriptional regulator [Victivallales bacterium]|nr:AraC family transcriptional regulator [Victivallales bacterium]